MWYVLFPLSLHSNLALLFLTSILPQIMDLGDCDLARIIRFKQDGPLDSSIETENSNNASAAKLDIPFTRYYWQEMLQCVAAVHNHDIVHSDLKPANFLLVQGQLKLIDFGIANVIDIENTVNVHRDSHVGTPNYMSPESLQDSSTDEAVQVSMGKLMKLGKPSDVWSLGCILYQMVYGRPPFAHIPNTIHRVMAIMNPSISISYPPTGIGGSMVPSELRRTLRRCLNRDPSKRPTVKDLLAEGDEWLHPEDVEGRDLRISEDLLGQIIWNVARRFRDKSREGPTDEEVGRYARSFYEKIREWSEE
jgi:serine/threonine-protein kinase TTK/MPS1